MPRCTTSSSSRRPCCRSSWAATGWMTRAFTRIGLLGFCYVGMASAIRSSSSASRRVCPAFSRLARFPIQGLARIVHRARLMLTSSMQPRTLGLTRRMLNGHPSPAPRRPRPGRILGGRRQAGARRSPTRERAAPLSVGAKWPVASTKWRPLWIDAGLGWSTCCTSICDAFFVCLAFQF